MSARTVTPAEAEEMLKSRRCGTAGCTCVRRDREDLAATVASEPSRIAAAVAAERAAIVAVMEGVIDEYKRAARGAHHPEDGAGLREGIAALGSVAHQIKRRTP